MTKILNIFGYLKRTLENRLFLTFLLITILGLILRVYFIFNFGVFVDEVFYAEAARINSFSALLIHSFWIKDHGILYLLWLKILQFSITDIISIRLFNILSYLLISFSLFSFFKKIRNDLTSLIPTALFSFFPYFVYTNIYVSVYNFVILFSVLAFIFLSNYVLYDKKNNLLNLFLFEIFLTLAFYSDYASIYLYLSLADILLFTHLFKKDKFIYIFLALLLNINLILPGLGPFFNNLTAVQGLSSLCCSADSQFSVFFPDFLYYVFFRTNFILSLVILLFMTVSLLTFYFKSKNEIVKYLALYTGVGFLTGFTFLYFVNRYFLPLLVERTLFIFNFLIILFVYCLFLFTWKLKKTHILLILILISLIAWRFSQNSIVNGSLPEMNIHYKDLIGELVKNEDMKSVDEIIFFDKGYAYYPLEKYYFLGLSNYSKQSLTEGFGRKEYTLSRYYRNLEYYLRENRNQLFIFFTSTGNFNFNEIKKEITAYRKTNNSSFTSGKIFYYLNCSSEINCSFKKFY